MNFVCNDCKAKKHEDCKGKSWCDCAHRTDRVVVAK
jgi:hypothetical protein